MTTTKVAHPSGSLEKRFPISEGGLVNIDQLKRNARGQMGCFTYAQALAARVSHDTIRDLVRRGRWHELEPGVFRALPAAAPSWQQKLLALALSTEGVAYGRSAAALYQLLPPPKQPEVLVVRRDRNRLRPGLHSTRSLPSGEIAVVAGVRATLPARTIIDAAASMAPTATTRLVDRAIVRGLVRAETLQQRSLELRNSKRPGRAKVLNALATQHPDLAAARNEWEAEVLRLVAEAGLPLPVPDFEVVVDGERRFLDVAWPSPMVDLEFDGFAPHTVRTVFDDDRVRQNALVTAGWTVLRSTSETLRNHPLRLVASIRAALEPRGHETSPTSEVS